MFERIMSFLRDLPRAASETGSAVADDPRIAAAAILCHVMDADGVRKDVEWQSVRDALGKAYHVDGQSLDALLSAGERADHEAIDLYSFTSVLTRSLDEQDRIAFIRLLWDVVYADGELHELEDNTIWRVAELIGVDDRDRVLARRSAAAEARHSHVPDADA